MSSSTAGWVYAIDQDALLDGQGATVDVNGNAIAVFRVGEQFFAIANACPHRGGPLGSGEVEGFTVTCPWHGWCWDLRTGQNTRQPNSRVARFEIRVMEGRVFVAIDGAGVSE